MDTPLSSLIDAVEKGDQFATETLFSSLSVTTLLHEAYLDMAGRSDKNSVIARFMGHRAGDAWPYHRPCAQPKRNGLVSPRWSI